MENPQLKRVMEPTYLFKLTWPIFIELLLQMLVSNVDQFMMSRHSQISVAAIGNASQITNILILTFSVISLATTILVSQYLGAQREEEIPRVYALSLFFNFLVGLSISMLILLFHKQVFAWINLPEELIEETSIYISIVGGSLFLQAVFLTFSAIFRSNGRTKETMITSVVVNSLNIVGNFILINGLGPVPSMGIAGAAWSSAISRLVGVGIIILLYVRFIATPISFSNLRRFPFSMLVRLLKIGLPSGGESLSYNFTQMVIQRIVNGFGTVIITARVYANMIAMCTYILSSALSQAAQVIVGYLMGARMIEDTHKKVMQTVWLSMSISGVMSLLLFFLSVPIYSFFTKDPAVVEICRQIMFIELFLEQGRAVNMTMVRALQAAGDINFPIVLGVISEWVVAVGLGFYLSVILSWGIQGLWIAMACDECLRGTVFFIRWYGGAWKNKNIIA